jgi:hypothetical protein
MKNFVFPSALAFILAELAQNFSLVSDQAGDQLGKETDKKGVVKEKKLRGVKEHSSEAKSRIRAEWC